MSQRLKTSFIISCVITLLPIIAGIIMWDSFPDQIPIHFNSQGIADNYGSKFFVVVGLPMIFLAIHIFTVLTAVFSSKKAGGIEIIIWVTPILATLITAFMYATSLGIASDVKIIAPLITCAVFLFCGFLLWKYPTLEIINFPTNCIATRRFTGIAMIVCSFFGAVFVIFHIYCLLIIATIACIIAPIVYHFIRGKYIG